MLRSTIGILLSLAIGVQAQAKLPKTWEEVASNPKYIKSPTAEQARIQLIKNQKGGYGAIPIADRFVILVDPQGYPLVIFDLAMDQLSWTDKILGSIGIGQFSLRQLFQKYKTTKENPSVILNGAEKQLPEPVTQLDPWEESAHYGFYNDFKEVEEANLPFSSADDETRGIDAFAKIKFNDRWIAAHGGPKAANKRDGFAPASFTMGDIYYTAKQKQKLTAWAESFSKLVLRKTTKITDVEGFLSQFNLIWNAQAKEFTMTWSPSVAKAGAAPDLPAWVVNYADPTQILAGKYSLQQLESQTMLLESLLGQVGNILSILVTRITDNVQAQQDAHENQLLALLEAYLRGDYKLDIDADNLRQFADVTTTLLYLNKILETDDVANGPKKRRLVMDLEDKYRKENLEWLNKKGYEVKMWPDQRFATVFKDGKRKGVFSLAMKRMSLIKTPSVHVYENMKWFKAANRIGLEAFVTAVRVVMPSSFALSELLTKWINIPISIYVPSGFWNILFRSRAFAEVAYEGQMMGVVGEAMTGRHVMIPGYTMEELADLRKVLYGQRLNPFDVSLEKEPQQMDFNWQLIVNALNGGSRSLEVR
ncbi:MAG: hypothetical protein IT289_07830 [Oligoflexia bacterium]|nr:hypothetical protein [Oligoflexia bacterium]